MKKIMLVCVFCTGTLSAGLFPGYEKEAAEDLRWATGKMLEVSGVVLTGLRQNPKLGVLLFTGVALSAQEAGVFFCPDQDFLFNSTFFSSITHFMCIKE